MDGPGVVVAWIFPEQVHGAFSYSLAAMLRHDAMNGRHVCRPEGGLITISSGPRVAETRCQVVDQFATSHPSADWLMMVDSDMTFDPDIIERFLEVADPKEAPFLGALCFQGGRETKPAPTIWREISVEDGWYNIERVWDYPLDALCRVSATGGGCLFVHRNVFAAMNRPYPQGFGTLADGKTPNNYPWFAEGLIGPKGQPLGEDVAFCRKAGLLGIPVHVHTGIKTGHMKYFEITEPRYLAIHQAEKMAVQEQKMNRAARRKAARKKVA